MYSVVYRLDWWLDSAPLVAGDDPVEAAASHHHRRGVLPAQGPYSAHQLTWV